MSENTGQDKNSFTLECPHVDYRIFFIVIFAALCILIFVIAPERGVAVPFSAKMALVFCVAFVAMSFRNAGKNVFSLNDDHIALHNGAKIPYKKIKNVMMTNSLAQFVFTDNDGNEKKLNIIFGEIKKQFRKHAYETLAAHLRKHDIIIYPDKAARSAAEKNAKDRE